MIWHTIRISLEPMDDAAMRAYCDRERMTYALFLRRALEHMLLTTTKKSKGDIEDHRDVYGRLGGTSFSVRLTDVERNNIVKLARMLNFKEKRSFSRLSRYAIKTYLAFCASEKRPEQSPEPASEDIPLPSAS
jgi:hypothetical protein